MADKISFEPPRGMRDFYPEDMAWRSRVFDAFRAAGEAAGFRQYDACVVESYELLARKAGEEVGEQIYHFFDKSERHLALRAEMTPTLARMVAQRQKELSFPLKWTTIAQCFRYERMTKGRKREHYQWNVDIVGEVLLLFQATDRKTGRERISVSRGCIPSKESYWAQIQCFLPPHSPLWVHCLSVSSKSQCG